MTIVEFFNPMEIEHIKAYRYFEEHCHFPVGFAPDDIEYPKLWQVSLISKLAQYWIKYIEVTNSDDSKV